MRSITFLLILLVSLESYSQPDPESLRLKGLKFTNSGDYDSSLHYLNLSKAAYLQGGNYIGLANVISNQAAVKTFQGNYTESFALYQQAASIYSKLNHHQGIIKSYVNIANQYLRTEAFQDALEYYLKAEEFADKLNFSKYNGYIYNGLGSVLSNRNNSGRNLPEAIKYYTRALSIFESNLDEKNAARVYNNLAIIYDEQGNIELATNSYQKYLRMALEVGNPGMQLRAYHNLGKIYLETENYAQSLDYLKNAERLAQEIPDPLNYIHILANLVDVYISLGDILQSRQYLSSYKELRDSLFSEEKTEALSELQVKYKTKEKEELLEKQIELSNERRLRNIYLTVFSSLLVLAIVGIIWLNRKRRFQELATLDKVREVESLKANIEGEEKERQRLANDLHDSVGGVLTAVRMIHSSYKESIGEKGNKVDRLLQEAADTVREVSHNLSTSALERFGLQKSIEQSLKSLPDHYEVNFSIEIPKHGVSKEAEKSINFIIKELINNTIKHANAKSIEIEINKFNGCLLLTYEDDGVGFDSNKEVVGLGMTSIRNRVDLLGGTIEINSSEGEGFLCSIEIDV